MSYMCPVCNGLQSLDARCPNCGSGLEDDGRLGDYYGPYSPYRPIDDLKWTNGFSDDLSTHQCLHAARCPRCLSAYTLSVAEWDA